jgi:hypothetical protein
MAECFLRQQSPLPRKAAFYCILAGFNFNKANQRHHGLRCYLKAHALHRRLGWGLAEDHLNLAIARQCLNVGLTAVRVFGG